MNCTIRFAALVISASVLALPGWADGPYKTKASATLQLQGTDFASRVDDDDVTGFFDQYDFTRNKDNGFPVELGLSDFRVDVLGAEDTPLLLLRLRSPGSNLSLSGDGLPLNETFLNQRGELLLRPAGVALDLDYHRLRTDELRLFPAASGVGTGIASVFNDNTSAGDRYYIQRTGIGGQLRLRPGELTSDTLGDWISELAIRSGWEERTGKRQLRFMLGGSDRAGGGANDFIRWRALSMPVEQEIGDVGGGIVLSPGGLFTLALDLDHQRFHEDAPTVLQSQLNALEPLIRVDGVPFTLGDRSLRTSGFLPDTARTTGTVRFHTRLGGRSTIRGGLQMATLGQTGPGTPFERIAGLHGNRITTTSGNVAVDVWLTELLSANAFFRFDNRRNEMPRTTALFNPANGTQLDPFMKRYRNVTAGAEMVFHSHRTNRVAVGIEGRWTERDLRFATQTVPTADAVLERNAVVDEDTRTVKAYVRTSLRPARGVQVSGEAGYRNAPDTGYIRELDNLGYGQARASLTLPGAHPVTFSAFARGETGRNGDFKNVGETAGARERDFDRNNYAYGLTVSGSPSPQFTVFGSFFQHRDAQDFDLVRSTRRVFKEPGAALDVDFYKDSGLDYRADLTNVSLGGRAQLGEATDATLSYSFTRTNTRFLSETPTATTIDDASRIRSDIHSVGVECGHWLQDGLRFVLGYRFDAYRDRTAVLGSVGAVAPFNRSTRQHTVTVGVTLNTDLGKSSAKKRKSR